MEIKIDEVRERALKLQAEFETPKKLASQLVAELRNFTGDQAQRFTNCFIEELDSTSPRFLAVAGKGG